MKYSICASLLLLSFAAMAQDFSDLPIDERPVSGGIEKGIEGLQPGVRANSTTKYYVAVYNRAALDRDLPTHVIVTGHGGTAGTLFQNAATSRAKRYAEVFPTHQILLVTVNELDNDLNARRLQSWGYTILASRTNMLSVSLLLSELKPLKQIASFDLYSHANKINGAALDADFLTPQSDYVKVLKPKFTSDAFASIHGCNTGWYLAPVLADWWGVPVAGSFTGTHFERLHFTQDFYPYDTHLAPPGPWAVDNPYSFQQPLSCTGAACMRMHPDAYRYFGEWGLATNGLGFMRFFCGSVKTEECERRQALSLTGLLAKVNLTPLSPLADFMKVVKEYMCPINRDFPVKVLCEVGLDGALADGDNTYTPFLGKSSVCDARSCWEPQPREVSTAFMDQVKAFLRGYQTLTKVNSTAKR